MQNLSMNFYNRLPGSHPGAKFASFTVVTSGVMFILFQKKLLPENVAFVVSKALFYPTLPLTYVQRIGNLFTKIDDTLVAGVAPLSILNHPEELHAMGVRGVVNMCKEYDGPKGEYNRLGMKQLHLPTVDHFEPSVEALRDAVEFITAHKNRGEKCYAHCKAGHGRGGAVALAWLIHENPNDTTEELNKSLCSVRKVRKTLFKQRCIIAFKAWVDSRK